MAEGHIGTAFGALGALNVLVQRCTQGFAFWQRIDNVTESMETFNTRLGMQCARLASWAQEWGIGNNQHIKDQRFLMNESTVMNYLKRINRIIYDLSGLDSTFPSLSTAETLTSVDRRRRVDEVGSSISVEFHDPDGTDSTSTGFKSNPERLKWALQEGKLNERLTLLATLIQDLYFLLPPPYSDPAGVIVLGTALASQDAATLARVSHAIDSAPLQGLVWLKSIAYRTQGLAYGLGSRAYRLEELGLEEQSSRRNESHFIARYNGCSVFVEQKSTTVPRNDSIQRGVLNARIENVVLRLQDPLKPAELRTLPCLGIIESLPKMTDDTITSIYSIAYKIDIPHFFSLQEMLSQREKSKQDIQRIHNCLSLGRRFIVAQTLARAVMYLHFADWLHKAIRSDNILFFVAEDMAGLDSALPYLVGFEYSRSDALGEQTENIVENEDHKFYRHPKAHVVPVADLQQPLGGAGRYSKAYDIYSLGVILVELGLFKSAKRIVADRPGSNTEPSTTDIKDFLVESAIPKLKFAMGETYANAARICLDGSFDNFDRRGLDNEFYMKVVRRLELCSA